jgi:DNA-nicking Smr family endonuclease
MTARRGTRLTEAARWSEAARLREADRLTKAARSTEADRAAWAGFTRHMAPLSGRAEMAPPPPAAKPTQLPAPRQAAAAARPGVLGAPLAIGAPPAGVDRATWQRFRTGRLAAARKLDLHGMTAQRAFHALTGFLRAAHAEGLRCVEVVTGRGSGGESRGGEGAGVIRRELPLWLNRPDIRPLVLGAAHPHVTNRAHPHATTRAHPHAATRVHPHAANPGAVRLLLRRIR